MYQPNLVLTDIVMPDMEGIEFLRVLRKRRGGTDYRYFQKRRRAKVLEVGTPFWRHRGSQEAAL